MTADGTGSKLDEFGVTAIEDRTEKLPPAFPVTMANPDARSPFGNGRRYSHFFHRNSKYGRTAAASIMISAIG